MPLSLLRRAAAAALVAALGVVLSAWRPPVPDAAAIPCEFAGVARIVAVGDVHGAYDRFAEILRVAGVVDQRLRWTGGRTHLVQLGDVLDRGADSRKILDLIMRLAQEARRAGGRVHMLIGNHEAMRLIGDYRYVSPDEYATFATRGSEALRQRFLKSQPEADRDRLLAETPLGLLEMASAFAPKGSYGKWIRGLNAVVRIDDVVFVHGGLSPAYAGRSCASINDAIRTELTSDLEKTRTGKSTSLSFGADGPLWYRGLAQQPDTFAPEVDAILAGQGARAMVMGHTVQQGGRIGVRFSGRVFLIDTGMQEAYVATGRASALEIRGDVFTAIYSDGREVLRGGRLLHFD